MEYSAEFQYDDSMNDTYNYTFNYNDMLDENCTSCGSKSYAINMVALVFYCLTCALGIPGNALVVWIAGIKMKKTVNTTWFLNLAIADLLCCLSLPFTVADMLLDSHWPYGNVMCKVLPAIIVLNMFASVFTLSFIGLDRFIQVVKPVWAQNNRSLRLAWVCCGVAWALAFLLSLPTMVLREHVTDEAFNFSGCLFSLNNDSVELYLDDSYRALIVGRFVLGFLIPLLSIAVCYALIARRVCSSNFRSGRAFRIMLAVVLAFFLSWLPYHVIGLLDIYGESQVRTVATTIDPLALALAYTNSCMNPILYVFMGQDFKEKIKLSLRRVFEKAFSEDKTLSSGYTKEQSSHGTLTSEAQL
ncbi:C3a anaphylatoxin chemotactic receptor [Hoplias malabaricus]|uniref:C3a anaphylatoxin chemotactic receptor n=1 Tax=Hoplias malabaricus TaxID=27720 RepID=UPI003462759C